MKELFTKKYLQIILVILASLTILSCSGSGNIEARDVEWQCDTDKCKVSFQLINSGIIETEAQFVIRAHKRTTNAFATQNKVIAEIYGNKLLSPGESKLVEESFQIKEPPNQIVVSAWSNE